MSVFIPVTFFLNLSVGRQWSRAMAKAVRTQAVPWLKSSVFHCGGSGSFPCVNEGFVADKVALGQIFLRALRFYVVITIPPVPYTYSLTRVLGE